VPLGGDLVDSSPGAGAWPSLTRASRELTEPWHVAYLRSRAPVHTPPRPCRRPRPASLSDRAHRTHDCRARVSKARRVVRNSAHEGRVAKPMSCRRSKARRWSAGRGTTSV
jgi:hypothetical protein